MGGGVGCVCGVEAVDEVADEEGEPIEAAAAEVCSTTAVATGAEAATSSEAEAGAAATAAAAATDEGDDDDEPAGSELWDDSLPGIFGNEHTSQRVISSWFWNVQRLQVHCSPAEPAPGWGSCSNPTPEHPPMVTLLY